jgi:hypothetical protein
VHYLHFKGATNMSGPEAIPDSASTVHWRTWLQRHSVLIRNRDWVGIAIEVAVVTVGVLLAFQIDQWGQDRRHVREERQFLERMWRETAGGIQENDWVIQVHARNRRVAVEGLRRANEPSELASFAASTHSCFGASFPGLGFNDTSYEELSASGRLNVVSDLALRSALREVAAAQADAVSQLDYARSQAIPITDALEEFIILGFDQDGNRICRVNWPALVKDHHARNAVVRSARLHGLMWLKRAYSRDVLAKAHNAIACKLGKPDCRAKVEQIVGYQLRSDVLPPDLSRKAMSPTGK